MSLWSTNTEPRERKWWWKSIKQTNYKTHTVVSQEDSWHDHDGGLILVIVGDGEDWRGTWCDVDHLTVPSTASYHIQFALLQMVLHSENGCVFPSFALFGLFFLLLTQLLGILLEDPRPGVASSSTQVIGALHWCPATNGSLKKNPITSYYAKDQSSMFYPL